MGTPRRVAIVLDEHDRFEGTPYLLHLLLEAWRRRGHEISLVRRPKDASAGDCAFMHVNLTRVPAASRALGWRYPVLVNGRVDDISKRRVASHLLFHPGGATGPVIVKTDRNAGGSRERQRSKRVAWRRILGRLARRSLPWSWTGRLGRHGYRVFPSAADVPLPVWVNPRLVVQRFLPERQGDLHVLRQWLFLGDREAGFALRSPNPIVKVASTVQAETMDDVPEALRAHRRRLGFDYGKFDYGVVDGEVVLYDANHTPTVPQGPPSPRLRRVAEVLAVGIDGFLR